VKGMYAVAGEPIPDFIAELTDEGTEAEEA
jgi:hypothetical protein